MYIYVSRPRCSASDGMQYPPSEDPDSDEDDFVPQADRKRKASKQSSLNSKKPVLRSAFPSRPPVVPAPPALHRDPPLIEYKFTCTIARVGDKGKVIFENTPDTKEIMVATDWKDGQSIAEAARISDDSIGFDDSQRFKTGYIGEGMTKRGVYVSWNRRFTV